MIPFPVGGTLHMKQLHKADRVLLAGNIQNAYQVPGRGHFDAPYNAIKQSRFGECVLAGRSTIQGNLRVVVED
jgi:hypothetical protein